MSGQSKPKHTISKSLAKALGIDNDGWQKFLLTAELLRQTMGSSDDGKFSVSNLDKFYGTKPEKLETFEAQCQSICLHLSLVTPSAVGNTLLSPDLQFPCTLHYRLAYVTQFPLLCTGETLLSSRVPEMLEIDNESVGIEYRPVNLSGAP